MDTKSLSVAVAKEEIGFLLARSKRDEADIRSKVGYREIGLVQGYDDNDGNFRAGDNVPLGWIVSLSSRKRFDRESDGYGVKTQREIEGRGQVLAGISARKLTLCTSLCANWVTRVRGKGIPPLPSRKEKGRRMRWNIAQTKWIVKVARLDPPPFLSNNNLRVLGEFNSKILPPGSNGQDRLFDLARGSSKEYKGLSSRHFSSRWGGGGDGFRLRLVNRRLRN